MKNNSVVSEGQINSEGSVAPSHQGFSLNLAPTEQLIDNRVYRLPPVDHINNPTFENLRITVMNPEVANNGDEHSFNRYHPLRTGRSRGSGLTRFADNLYRKK